MNLLFTISLDLLVKIVTLLLPLFGFFGYWIKRYYDYKTKMNVIKFDLFYQNKLNAVKDFYSAYMEFEMTFNTYYLKLFTEGKEKEFDGFFIPKRDKLFFAYSHIQLFENDKNVLPFKRIIDRNVLLYNDIIKLSLGIGVKHDERDSISKTNNANSLSRQTSLADNEDLKVIGTQTRMEFNIK